MSELLTEMIKPELFVLVPVLYLLGIALKKSNLSDRHIPWILGAAGVFLSLVWVLATCALNSWQAILLAVFSGIVQGILTAGASVYVNQMIKQAGKNE